MNMRSHIRKLEALMEAEEIKQDMSDREQEAFDKGANWLNNYINQALEAVKLPVVNEVKPPCE